ncbi:MAG TPA: protein kinase [Gemmatimonadales bacterium]|nr:protein kinase [Gemmatimonadales bacterium]
MSADLLSRLQASLGDRYRVEREVGRGGMATVFLAHDLRHDRPVAVKVFHPQLGDALGERFLREIRLAARLGHPHILTVHDSGNADGLLWYTMPVVDGESLRQRLIREGPLPLEDAVRIGRSVAEALDFAHTHGVVHRDIKPENILLFRGEPMVADFGIALALDAADQERLTQTGFSLGTPLYMSPEQMLGGGPVDGRSDIYSLGCVVYEMLSGEPPFTGPSPQAVVAKRLTTAPVPLGAVRDVPEALERTVQKALARNPADRFARAGDFARALADPASSGSEKVSGGATAAVRGRSWRMPAVLLLLALASALAWLTLGRSFGAAEPSASRLAVLPFTVPSARQFSYLGEGMVDLLTRNLNGVGDQVTVDPGRVMSELDAGEKGGVRDVQSGLQIARRLGAGRYILGSVHVAGAHLRIQAQLYKEGSGTPEPIAQAFAEGDSAALFDLVDRLSAQLLVGGDRSQGARLAQTAAVTTRSLPALKAYLDAERNLRAARFDSAVAGFQTATSLDSTFALAHYRLGVAAMWNGRMGLLAPSIARARALVDRLGDRDRALLSAFADMARGFPDAAERQYRAILEKYPDDLEARFQLANVLYAYNAPRGRPPGEAREQYEYVLEVDPKFICPI